MSLPWIRLDSRTGDGTASSAAQSRSGIRMALNSDRTSYSLFIQGSTTPENIRSCWTTWLYKEQNPKRYLNNFLPHLSARSVITYVLLFRYWTGMVLEINSNLRYASFCDSPEQVHGMHGGAGFCRLLSSSQSGWHGTSVKPMEATNSSHAHGSSTRGQRQWHVLLFTVLHADLVLHLSAKWLPCHYHSNLDENWALEGV